MGSNLPPRQVNSNILLSHVFPQTSLINFKNLFWSSLSWYMASHDHPSRLHVKTLQHIQFKAFMPLLNCENLDLTLQIPSRNARISSCTLQGRNLGCYTRFQMDIFSLTEVKIVARYRAIGKFFKVSPQVTSL
jgi:hypothetical protein